ncbi:uncharacterized protein [Equus przewalskii]|uniref:Uncharacterized protein isoform X2 n=1 Tax=Equus przewalskii TaxID=9798 RepID=A0ABM4MAU9_EQUPR|nr:uncharacterized protein LOC111770379 isoform X2 [Equus caballus]
MQQPEQRGLLVTMLSQGRRSGGRKRAPFSLPSIAGPPAASRGRIGGCGGAALAVAPPPGRAVPRPSCLRSRPEPRLQPRARPGSAARLPPGPGPCWVLARAAAARGRAAARTYGGQLASTVTARENRKSRQPLSKLDAGGAEELELNVKSWQKMSKEKHWLPLNSRKADVRICSPRVTRRAVTGSRSFAPCACDILLRKRLSLAASLEDVDDFPGELLGKINAKLTG